MMKKGILLFLLASLLIIGAGAVGCGSSLPKPQEGRLHLPENNDQAEIPPYQVASDTLQYRLGPGDVISIIVHEEPDISREGVTVRYDGYITHYLIGDVLATGRTLAQVDTLITEAMKHYILGPEVTIFLQQSNSKRFVILGGVSQPGVYPLVNAVRLTDAVAMAGGIPRSSASGAIGDDPIGTYAADLSGLYILRGNQKIHVDLSAVYSGGDLFQDIYLQPDDYVYVPMPDIRTIYVFGEVSQPGVIRTGRPISLAQVLFAAGGILPSAKKSSIQVLYGSGQLTENITVNLNDILDGNDYDLELQDGNIVYVPRSEFHQATNLIQQFINTVQSIQLTRLLIDDLENATNTN